ncbi:MAG: 1-acyl-sn-glycerol-3-phosphate acyltransferase [Bacilli bacterium]|nr:1-acyl-sn-glycerol-3-phosphate acyltransferase [Bacilli bacterium]
MKIEEYFDPRCVKFPYPMDTGNHYLIVKKDDGTVFDENYPYIDDSKSFKTKQKFFKVFMYVVYYPIMLIRTGLRIKGKENLKKYKDAISNGVVSICNHVHMWDYPMITWGVRPIKTRILVWDKNISGENGKMIRMTGGIPIPTNNQKATMKYMSAVRKYINNGGWLHIYPEGSMWEYYAPVRPFKAGAFFFSVQCNKPIIPLAFTYRKPGWIRGKIFKQVALMTLNIGEPIYPDTSLAPNKRIEDLTIRAHKEVMKLAGRDPENNLYERIYNDSKRIDYYATEYGKNYKGSW